MEKKVINTNEAPSAIGPYSQAISCNNLLFISGQLPISPLNGEFAGDDIKTQTEQSLKNLCAILNECGLNTKMVLKTTVFLQNMADFAKMNEVYTEYFGCESPARSCVEVAKLPKGALVEIEAIACLPA